MIHVCKAGALSQLQDLGRWGHQRHGVPVSGVMDEWSHRLANILVGNPEDMATLECTLSGPTLRFARDTLVALCGADQGASFDGVAAPLGQPLLVRSGATLRFEAPGRGARVYLAVRGGFDVAPVLDSTSTFLRGGFGGFQGRALARGDRLPLHVSDAGFPGATRLLVQCGTPFVSVAQFDLPKPQGRLDEVRAMAGPQWPAFEPQAQAAFFGQTFRVGAQSDRMGYRLQGPALTLAQPLEMVSEGVSFGSVQVPPDGNPIILMADRQSAGGYPKIAYIASVDLPVLAQALPGATLGFARIALEEAQALYLAREAQLAALAAQVADAMRRDPASNDAPAEDGSTQDARFAAAPAA